MPLDLLFPHLLPPSDAPPRIRAARLPHAERWLSRAEVSEAPSADADRWLWREHGQGDPCPVAAVGLHGEGGDATGPTLRADPVHLRVENDALVLHDASILGLTIAEARSLAGALSAHFAADGLAFEAMAPDRWYVRMAGTATPPRTVPLDEAFGRNVFGMLPKGGSLNWAGILTEAQMVLAAHALNGTREPAVNSVWFWGEGDAPERLERRYDAIHAGAPFAKGVALLSGARTAPVPAGIDALTATITGQRTLVVEDSLTAPLRRADEEGWIAAAARIDSAWFATLAAAIARFTTVRIILPSERHTRIASLTRAARWRWFRARKPLAAHA